MCPTKQSMKHKHMYFCLSMATSFGMHRPSSDHYYKTFEIRSTIVQLQFALRDITCGQVSLVGLLPVFLVFRSAQLATRRLQLHLTVTRCESHIFNFYFQSLAQFCNLCIPMIFSFTYVTQMYSRFPPPPPPPTESLIIS